MKTIKDRVKGEHYMPETKDENEHHLAPNQSYTKTYLQILRDDYSIYYDGYGCHAFKIIPRPTGNPLVQLFTEDDGYLSATDITFDAFWAKNLIASNTQKGIVNMRKIKHWQGYGCVYADKIRMTTEAGIRTLVIKVTGNHECGIARNDKYDVSWWLIKRFDKTFEDYRNIISLDLDEQWDDIKKEDSCVYTIRYRV